MPLQNRVSPFGELFATPARGMLFGNRGGRIHRDDRSLGARRWTSRAWICCRLEFNGRQRIVWGRGYTELFFLDEPTAFAAGHRPCFECRRHHAGNFAAAFPLPSLAQARPRAADMDNVLHAERLNGRAKRLHRRESDDLPDGAFIVLDGKAFALRGDNLLRWTPSGYAAAQDRRRDMMVDVLTPPAILAVLGAGYRPLWHPSADPSP